MLPRNDASTVDCMVICAGVPRTVGTAYLSMNGHRMVCIFMWLLESSVSNMRLRTNEIDQDLSKNFSLRH